MPMDEENTEDMTMTAREVADYLGISRTSLQRLFIATKRLSPVNPPLGTGLTRYRRLRFRKSDVEKLKPPADPT